MNDYIKSPLNYTGGKYKILKDILPLFPKEIDTFIDVFGGGFNVGINVKANKIIYNDIESHVVDLMRYIQKTPTEKLLREIDIIIDYFNLKKEESEGFLRLREIYNISESKPPILLYTMICYAFNYQIRFNRKGQYNMPSGKNRSSFNPSLRKKFVLFANALHNKNCIFKNESFYAIDFSTLSSNDFVYCDPPYLNSTATYNENNNWTEVDEEKLLEILDNLNKNKIKFALSNNLKYNNPILEDWKHKYFVHYIGSYHNNCSYNKKDRTKDNEILITNY